MYECLNEDMLCEFVCLYECVSEYVFVLLCVTV